MPPHPKEMHSKDERRALNTAENAMKAVAAARAFLPALKPGRVWRHRAPHGMEIKGSLAYNQEHVLILHFSSEDGSVLPKGLHGYSEGTAEVLAQIEKSLSGLNAALSVLEGAEFREPEFCWAVPVVFGGRIVSHIKITANATELVPDKKAAAEIETIQT